MKKIKLFSLLAVGISMVLCSCEKAQEVDQKVAVELVSKGAQKVVTEAPNLEFSANYEVSFKSKFEREDGVEETNISANLDFNAAVTLDREDNSDTKGEADLSLLFTNSIKYTYNDTSIEPVVTNEKVSVTGNLYCDSSKLYLYLNADTGTGEEVQPLKGYLTYEFLLQEIQSIIGSLVGGGSSSGEVVPTLNANEPVTVEEQIYALVPYFFNISATEKGDVLTVEAQLTYESFKEGFTRFSALSAGLDYDSLPEEQQTALKAAVEQQLATLLGANAKTDASLTLKVDKDGYLSYFGGNVDLAFAINGGEFEISATFENSLTVKDVSVNLPTDLDTYVSLEK